MTPIPNLKDDLRTTAELVALALTEVDDEIAGNAVGLTCFRSPDWRNGENLTTMRT
jgi:hypothetical protein